MTTALKLPLSFRTALRIGLMTLALNALAGETPGADDRGHRDLLSELKVRDALGQDTRLRPLNIMVQVKDRVATLSGQVPSRELARPALDAAKKVPDVREVCDNMSVQNEDASLLLPLPVMAPGKMLPAPGSSAIKLTELKPSKPPLLGVWIPVNPQPMDQPIIGVALLPWIVPQPGSAGAVSLPKNKPAAESSDAAAIAAAVQSLLQGDERFRRLRFELKQGKVYLNGAVHRWSDLQELARAATNIPGVEGVVLKDVKTDGR